MFLAELQEDVRIIIPAIAESLKTRILMFARPPSREFQGWQTRVRVSITFRWVC